MGVWGWVYIYEKVGYWVDKGCVIRDEFGLEMWFFYVIEGRRIEFLY